MSTDPKAHIWRFTNRYGETWQFTYDPATKQGKLSGSDVGSQVYQVIEGMAVGLILNDEEIQWLRQTWREATAGS